MATFILMYYRVKTPALLPLLTPSCTWKVKRATDTVFLTFDDGPHPTITPWVLDQLDAFDAKATFFCIGKNVAAYPHIYEEIIKRGHSVGNHTMHHMNGWTTQRKTYLSDIDAAAKHISSHLFRPPYGKITPFQMKALIQKGYELVMWDVLSGDFDVQLEPAVMIQQMLPQIEGGSIIVFHDSEKAWPRLKEGLPATLTWLLEKGWKSKAYTK